jgi:hypothetical protein
MYLFCVWNTSVSFRVVVWAILWLRRPLYRARQSLNHQLFTCRQSEIGGETETELARPAEPYRHRALRERNL